MITAEDAVEKAYDYLIKLASLPEKAPRDVMLEEVEPATDPDAWRVTFSYAVPGEPGPEPEAAGGPLRRFLSIPRRVYKVVSVGGEDGEFLSLKIPE